MKVNEVWVPILDWELNYEISNLGKVRSLRTGNLLRPCIVNGYPTVHLQANPGKPNAKKRMAKIHRLMMESFTGYKPKGHELHAAHDDGNKANNWLGNLRWATVSSNHLDKHKHGKMPLGEKHKRSKLTELEIKYIRRELERGAPIAELAEQFKVSRTHVWMIGKRTTWKHL
jgi:hypothetical protein